MLLSTAEQANFNYMLCSNEKQLIKFAELYSVLAVAMFNENSMEANIVRGNKETFGVLCDVSMFCAIKAQRTNEILSGIVVNNPDLIKLLKLKNNEAVEKLKETVNKYELIVCGESTSSEVMGKLDKFNPNIVAPDTFEEKEEEEDTIEETDNIDSEGGLNANEGVAVEGNGEVVENLEREDFGDGTSDIKYDIDEVEKAKEMTRQAQDLVEKSQDVKSVSDSASDEAEEDIDVSDVELPDDAIEMIEAIISRLEAIYRSCLELDKPFGMLYDRGMLSYKIKDGYLNYVPGASQNGKSLFENLYRIIVEASGYSLTCAPSLKNVPNCENIANGGYNYYPGFLFKYALGIVDGKHKKSWNAFKNELKVSLKKRVKKLYKSNLFYDNMDKIENSFVNSILVLKYEKGAGIRLRVSFPGYNIDAKKLEEGIRTIRTYNNASITILPMQGLNDVLDVQILQDEDKYLNTPAWAYQAMQVKLNNGEIPSLLDGLPIGRKVSGEGFEYKLDPSVRFMNFLAAGSGAGKGVLTLSLVSSALGSGIPVYYIDYKPDMAPIFWRAEKELGVKSFTFDAMVKRHRGESNGIQGTDSMPKCVKNDLEEYCGAFLYLRAVQLMCAIAKYRANNGPKPSLFVFDECQAVMEEIQSAITKTIDLMNSNKPAKGEQPNEVYQYCLKVLNWIINVDGAINTYTITTGRKSSVLSLFIAQSADINLWKRFGTKVKIGPGDGKSVMLISRIIESGTVCKILGKGTDTSKYGLGGNISKAVSAKELGYVTNNRHFAIYDGKTTENAKITVFKPFLTLNYDDPLEHCWTDGLGKMFGAGSIDNESYIENVKEAHPGEEGYTNKYGIHTGTGMLGLASMYCGGDINKVGTNIAKGYYDCLEFFKESNLCERYSTPEEYMYDMSLDGFISVGNMIQYTKGCESDSVSYSSEEGADGSEVETGFKIEDGDSGLEKPTGVDKLKIEESMKKEQELIDAVNSQNNAQEMLDKVADSVLSVSKEDVDNMGNNGKRDLDRLERALINRDISGVAEVIANNNELYSMLGKDGRLNQVDLTQTAKAAKLTRDNSLDCTNVGAGPTSWLEGIYEKTPRGSRVYFDKLFKSLLEEITANGVRPSLVTRVGLYENNMFINNKICNLNGVVGGVNDIRLVDMIKYKTLFKKFKGIKELRIDMDFVEAAMNEYKLYTEDVVQVLEKLFKEGKKLTTIELKTRDGGIEKITRAGVLSKKAAKEIQERDSSRKLDAACMKVGSKPLEDRRLSEKFMAWDEGSLYNGAKFMFKNVGKANKDKPSFGGTLLWGGLGLGLGIVTTPLWVGIAGGKKLFRMFR